MRKIFLIFGLLLGLLLTACGVQAASLSQSLNGNKPFVLLVCTEWADGSAIYNNLKKLQPKFTNYNFTKVDLGVEEAAGLFTDKRFVVTEIPMVILGKKGGRFNQVVSTSCAADASCMAKELKRFGK